MNQALAGKVALVTGASSGIGEQTALALASAGARIVVVARRADRLAALVPRLGAGAFALESDLTAGDEARRIVGEAHARAGRLDILVNNAGVMLNATLAAATAEDWRRMIELNVLALMNATHAAWPLMKAQGGGHVVNVSSVAATIRNPGASVYSASKAAVNAFSESIRKEGASVGIRVTVVSPGFVISELVDHVPDPAMQKRSRDFMAAIRPLDSEDIADAIAFAVTRPAHVALNEIVIRPAQQEP